MRTKNKSGNTKTQRDTPLYQDHPKRRKQTNNSNMTGEINRGNTMNIGTSKNTNDLHTKNTVTGSDTDGQAE